MKLESQLMPDHFHGILFVKERQGKKLGNIVGRFKSKSTGRAGKPGREGGGRAAHGKEQDSGKRNTLTGRRRWC